MPITLYHLVHLNTADALCLPTGSREASMSGHALARSYLCTMHGLLRKRASGTCALYAAENMASRGQCQGYLSPFREFDRLGCIATTSRKLRDHVARTISVNVRYTAADTAVHHAVQGSNEAERWRYSFHSTNAKRFNLSDACDAS
jgi:hypothetical protein